MTRHTIKKILIANRGEIASRVIRTCKRLGITSVAVFSAVDSNGLWVKEADEAIALNGTTAADSYLKGDLIISICKKRNVDAIHPGYGFLSENADFAQKCEENGIIFIGPSPDSIRAIGDKIASKILLKAKAPSVPLIPGYNGQDQSVETFTREALKIGFPVLLKASAGGGGKGMRVVRDASNLQQEIRAAKGESLRSFGNDQLLIEKYFDRCKHIEVQIMGDSHGNVFHIFERECSVQRRHQKIIEECPASTLNDATRSKLYQAAMTIAKTIQYRGAGTVEFIFDPATELFYFLEVNTRLQVEHPITEETTGLDLVDGMIKVAEGYSLKDLGYDRLQQKGHAIECRLCAEDPMNNFFPCTGQISVLKFPTSLPFTRFDHSLHELNSEISVYYDPLISKIIVWGINRKEAIYRMIKVLQNTICLGLITNQPFLLQILNSTSFQDSTYTTRWLETWWADHLPGLKEIISKDEKLCNIIAAGIYWKVRDGQRQLWKFVPSGWRNGPRYAPQREIIGTCVIEYFVTPNKDIQIRALDKESKVFDGKVVRVAKGYSSESETNTTWQNLTIHNMYIIKQDPSGTTVGVASITLDTLHQKWPFVIQRKTSGDQIMWLHLQEKAYPLVIERKSRVACAVEDDNDLESAYCCPMPCKILSLLTDGSGTVKPGDALLTIESMKMETRVVSRHSGKVKYLVKEGQLVEAGTRLVEVEEQK